MPELESVLSRLNSLLTPPTYGTNETKIFEPLAEDANSALKNDLIKEAFRAIHLGNAAIETGQVHSVKLVDNSLFLRLTDMTDADAEKRDYFELLNNTQEVLLKINESAV